MHENLLKIMRQQVSISEKDVELCTHYFEPVIFSKNSIVEDVGEIPQYLYFIVSGYMRLFYYNDSGDEVTSRINCPPGFFTSYFNFINQTKSDEIVECITRCELLRISRVNLNLITSKSEAFKDFSIWVLQQSIAYNESRSKELATLTAEQRYLKLVDNYPQLIHNVPLQYIASFLGMNSKSLSRIRKQMIK